MGRFKRNIIAAARHAESVAGDWLMGVHTRGLVYFRETRGICQDAHDFGTAAHCNVRKIIRQMQPTTKDVAVVLGCGKGRAVCHMARTNVRKVIGIELSAELAEAAKVNAQKLRNRCAPIEIRNVDAANADMSEGTLFFMFNPFGAETLRAVLKNIKNSHDFTKSTVTIAYANPTCAQVVEEFPWLQIMYDYRRFLGQRVIIYKSK